MAEALTAPLQKKDVENPVGKAEKEALSQVFDPTKKYAFYLAAENPVPELPVYEVFKGKATVMPHKKFKPFQNLVLSSQIVWDGARANIRYYDGCDSIFVSKQPTDKDLIKQLIDQTKKRNFLNGKLIVEGSEGMLLLYLTICSWNAGSPFRTNSANEIFVSADTSKLLNAQQIKIDNMEKALKLAKEATPVKMKIHGAYLGIVDRDWDTDNELTDDEYRLEYRKFASQNSERFIETYGNKQIEVKYYVDKAVMDGTINNKSNPNKATWGSGNTEICDISGLKSTEAISQRVFEFSQTEAGQEFLIQLKALYEN